MADDFAGLTNKELKDLIEKRYDAARQGGTINAITRVVRSLGEAGVFEADGVRVVYGRHLEAYVGGKQVLSTEEYAGYFIPGPWVKVVLDRAPEAESLERREREAMEQGERRRLLEKLLGPEDG